MEKASSVQGQEDGIIESFRSWVGQNERDEDKQKSLFLTVLTICAYELYMSGKKVDVDKRIADAREIAADGWREDLH